MSSEAEEIESLLDRLLNASCSEAHDFVLDWRQEREKKEYAYMPSLRLAHELLSEQEGWGVYTQPNNNRLNKEANMLVHLACNRHFPNWWLAPEVLGGATHDPEIDCRSCKERLPLEAYHIFWSIYRLLNMKKSQ